MTTRQIRRAAERKERKLARKQQVQEPAATPIRNPEPSEGSPSRAEINRANSQHSSGPRTPEGKARSSRNSFKHGLYSQQLVMPGENPAERGFHKALAELRRLQKGRDEAAHLSEPKTQANNVVPQNPAEPDSDFVPQVFHVEDLDNYLDHPKFEEIYAQYVSHLGRQMTEAA